MSTTRRRNPRSPPTWVEVQRVDRKVAPHRVLGLRSVDVVGESRPCSSVASSDFCAARNVDTSRTSAPDVHVHETESPPMMYARRKRGFTCSGVASVAMSKSFGVRPSSRSRTAPPTTNALNPRLVQLLDDGAGAARHLVAADRVVACLVDARFAPAGRASGGQAGGGSSQARRFFECRERARDRRGPSAIVRARPSSVHGPTARAREAQRRPPPHRRRHPAHLAVATLVEDGATARRSGSCGRGWEGRAATGPAARASRGPRARGRDRRAARHAPTRRASASGPATPSTCTQ